MTLQQDIREAAQYVLDAIGPGHSEAIYQNGLRYKLTAMGYHVQTEIDVPVVMDNIVLGTARCDMIINHTYVIELKSISKITFLRKDNELIQLEKYIQFLPDTTTQGMLINFSKNDGCIFYEINL